MSGHEPHIITETAALALLALLAPLVSALLTWAIPARYAWIVSLTAPVLLLVSATAGAFLFARGWHMPPQTWSVEWFTLGAHGVSVGMHIDSLSVIMVMVVSVVSFLVHVYSTGYMAGDQAFRRYFAMLGFFTFAMLGLVLADNLLLLFVFWELVGFSSYMLIGHWTELPEAGRAAKKAFIINRIGDLGFLAGLLIIYTHTGSFQLTGLPQDGALAWQTAASLCLFCGVIGKSAQFPLLTWLPDAMAGPSPVSALIHAATMVAAGVFLLARVFFLFTPDSLEVVAIIGAVTSLTGAVAALFQFDIKKVLAYSTISQLGFMVLAMGAGSKESAMLHLFTHAFFKAGLFLGAGSVIHALHLAQHGGPHTVNVQDIRNLGGLRHSLPVTFVAFVICGAALAGMPFFSGFQSKDAILSALITWAPQEPAWRWIVVAAAFGVSFLTVCYTFRLIWYVFVRANTNSETQHLVVTEAPVVMRLPLVLLAGCSGWWMVAWSPVNFSGWFHSFGESSHTVTFLSAAWVLAALLVAFLYFRKRPLGPVDRGRPFNALAHTFYLDLIYDRLVVQPLHRLSGVTSFIDRTLIDGLIHVAAYAQVTLAHLAGWFDHALLDGTVNGIARVAGGIGAFTRSFQGGKIQYYIFWALFALALVLLYLMI